MARQNCRLSVERLGERDVPAAFGNPWFDPTHLTMSFAPDDTSVSGVQSSLFATLDAQMPRAEWQAILRRAAQTWSEAANLNVGIVADGGQAFGVDGQTQADPRFGDIRIGAMPMAGDALGEAVAPDSLLAGTFAGDVFFNSSTSFTPATLYRVALHEFGHALGLAPSTNPKSIMFNQANVNAALSPVDVVAIRALYGARTADPNEGALGNGRIGTATRMNFPSSYDGETPLVEFGLLGSRADVDVFRVRNLSDYSGPITLHLVTDGISMVVPQVSAYDFRGRLLGKVTGSDVNGDTVDLTLPTTLPGRMYYFRVETAPGCESRIGRFGLAATYDDRLVAPGIAIDDVLRGPYDQLDSDDLNDLFEHPERAFYNDDGGSDDNSHGAEDLRGKGIGAGQSRFATTASLGTATDVDFFRIRAPSVGPRTALSLVVSTQTIGPAGTTPKIELFDRDLNPVAAEILLNGNGDYTVQLKGAESGRRYYVRVSGDAPGNFALEAIFRKQAVDLQTFAAGSATAVDPAAYKLYAARTQLFGFALSANGPAGSAIEFKIKNLAGDTVYSLTAQSGQTVSGLSTFLAPGEYTVTMTAIGTTGPVTFTLRGAVQTDPIGPQPADSTLAPIYQDPSVPNQYVYPGGTVSFDPFLWIVWAII